MEKNTNLEFWESVEKTDPKYTKQVNFGRKYTAIDAQYQVKKATEMFGKYGTWGLKDVNIEKVYIGEDIMLEIKAKFFWNEGEFEISNANMLLTKGRIDTDAYKKLETDTLTKALSKLGFNADIFLGKFEDNNYVNEMKGTFETINDNQRSELAKLIQDSNTDLAKFNDNYAIDNLSELPIKEFERAKALLTTKINKAK